MRRSATARELRYLRLACRFDRQERDPFVLVFSVIVPWMVYAGLFACYAGLANESLWRRIFWGGLGAIALSLLASTLRLKQKVEACFRRPVVIDNLSGPFFNLADDSRSQSEVSQDDYRIGDQRVHVPSHWKRLSVTLGHRPVEAEVYRGPWGMTFPVSLKNLTAIETDIDNGLLNYRPLGLGVRASAVVLPVCTLVAALVPGIAPARMAGGLSHNPFVLVSFGASATLVALTMVSTFNNRSVLVRLRRGTAQPAVANRARKNGTGA